MNPDLKAEAIATFIGLLDEARAAGDPEPTAMTLATVGADGRISARVVLLKEVDERGFVFYTNTLSRKGRALAVEPQAALLFHWKTLRDQVQVRIEGSVAPVTAQEADAYFASRPRESQLGAWAIACRMESGLPGCCIPELPTCAGVSKVRPCFNLALL